MYRNCACLALGLGITLFCQNSTYALDCCGPWPWDNPCIDFTLTGQTGLYYDLDAHPQQECNPEDCDEGCNSCDTITVKVTVESGTVNTYIKTGSFSWGDWGLSSSASTEESYHSTSESQRSCNTAGCCVGPGYGYIVYNYTQKVSRTWGYDAVADEYVECTPCAESFKFGILRTYTYVETGFNERNEYEPEPYDTGDFCD